MTTSTNTAIVMDIVIHATTPGMRQGSTKLTANPAAGADPIISSEALKQFHTIATAFWIVMSLCGVVTNLLNIRAFLRMGLGGDGSSTTFSFFALAVSDLSVCGIASVEMAGFLCMVVEAELGLWFHLPPTIPTYYMMCVRRVFNTTTALMTTFIAVQRCLSVAFPFRVRGMFTLARTHVITAAFLGFSVTCYSLFVWRHEMVENPATTTITTSGGDLHNASQRQQLALKVIPGSEPVLFLIEVVLGMALNMGCQGIVLVCFLVMVVELRKAATFRQSARAGCETTTATTTTTTTTTTMRGKGDNGGKNMNGPEKTSSTSSGSSSSSSRENQALVQVALLSFIFIVTNSPYMVFGVANLSIPEFGLNQQLHNLYHLVHNFMFTGELVSSGVNFFVYYKYNSRFRKACFNSGGRT